MKIVHITNIHNQLHAVLDNNHIVRISDFKGSPRVGCNVDIINEQWQVVGNNVDESCLNGICDLQPPQGK